MKIKGKGDDMNKNEIRAAVKGVQEEGVRTSLYVRQFDPFIADEPESLGGTDQGPNPVEYVLSGLVGCKSVMIAIIAKELDFIYEDVSIEADGALDMRGLMGFKGVSPNFQRASVHITMKTKETEERMKALMERVGSRCPVMALFTESGIPVDVTWTLQQ